MSGAALTDSENRKSKADDGDDDPEDGHVVPPKDGVPPAYG